MTMQPKPFSELEQLNDANGDEQFPVIRDGKNYRLKTNDLPISAATAAALENIVAGQDPGSNLQDFVYGQDLVAGTPARIVDDGGTPKLKDFKTIFEVGDIDPSTEPDTVNGEVYASDFVDEERVISVYKDGTAFKVRLLDYSGGTEPTYGAGIALDASLDNPVLVHSSFDMQKFIVVADNNNFEVFSLDKSVMTSESTGVLPNRLAGSGKIAAELLMPEKPDAQQHPTHDIVMFFENASNQLAGHVVSLRDPALAEFGSAYLLADVAPSFISSGRIAGNEVMVCYGDSVNDENRAVHVHVDSVQHRVLLHETVESPVTISAPATEMLFLRTSNNVLNSNDGLFIYTAANGGVSAKHAVTDTNYRVTLGLEQTIESDVAFNSKLDAVHGFQSQPWRFDYNYVSVSDGSKVKMFMISVVDGALSVQKTIEHTIATTPQANQKYMYRIGEQNIIIHPSSDLWLHWSPVITEFDKTDFAGIVQVTANEGETGKIRLSGGVSNVHTGLNPGEGVFVDIMGDLTMGVSSVRVGRAISATRMLVDFQDGKVPDNKVTVGYGDEYDYKVNPRTNDFLKQVNDARRELNKVNGGKILLGPGEFVADPTAAQTPADLYLNLRGSNIVLEGIAPFTTEIKLADFGDIDVIVSGGGWGDYLDYGDSGDPPNSRDWTWAPNDNVSIRNLSVNGNKYKQTQDNAEYVTKKYSNAQTRNLVRYRNDSLRDYGGVTENLVLYNGIQNGLSNESRLHHNSINVHVYNCDLFNFYQEFGSQWNVTDCHSYNAGQAGIKLFDSGETSIKGFMSRSDDGAGIFVQGGGRVSITDSKLHRSGWHRDVNNTPATGIKLSGTRQISIIGNDFYAVQGHAISMNTVTESIISFNKFRRTGQYQDISYSDILFNTIGGNHDNVIMGNKFQNDTANYYANKARYNINYAIPGKDYDNVFIANVPGDAHLGYMANVPENDENDNTQQILYGDSYFGGNARLWNQMATFLGIGTKIDNRQAVLMRDSVDSKLTLTNVVQGSPSTPKAVASDGVGSTITLSHDEALNCSSDFTWSIYVKFNSLANNPRLFEKGYKFQILSAGKLRLKMFGGLDKDFGVNGEIQTATGYLLTARRVGDTLSIFKGATKVGDITEAAVADTSTAAFTLGGSGNYRVDGTIDAARFYQRGLTDAEIADMAAEIIPTDDTDIVARWPMNEGSGATINDYSGNGRHLTMSDPTEWTDTIPFGSDPDPTYDYETVKIIESGDPRFDGDRGTLYVGDELGETIERSKRFIPMNLTLDEKGTPPANPIADHVIVYAKTDGKVYAKDSAGNEYDLTGGGGSGLLNNFSATTDPTATDDSGSGYAIGSVWINTSTDEAFRAVDVTVSTAVWVKTTLDASELANVATTGNADDLTEGSTNKLLTAAERTKLSSVETGATADQTDAEVEAAYNNQVAQASAGEKTAGTETGVRRLSPKDVKDMIDTHAASGGGGGDVVVPNKVVHSTDFYDTAKTEPFFPAGVGGGSVSEPAGVSNHPGIVKYRSSASANSGYRYGGSGVHNQILLDTEQEFHFIFKAYTQADNVVYGGFIDMTGLADPGDGAYLKQTGASIEGQTADSSTISSTATSGTLVDGNWYHGKIACNAAGTEITYTVYNEDGTTLWTDTLTTNIPSGPTSHGVLGGSIGTTAQDVVELDYMAIKQTLQRGA